MSGLVITLALALVAQEPAMPGAAMADRIAARVSSPSAEACQTAVEEAGVRNAEALFTGASICTQIDAGDDAAFLMLAAQARGMADLASTMTGRTGDPPFGALDLYGFIFFYGGGAGETAMYRDAERTDRLFSRLRSWAPARGADYDPGWGERGGMDDAAYLALIEASVTSRIHQLAELAKLYRDDQYHALQKELEALMAANGATFEEGTPAHQRMQAIQSEQAVIAGRLNRQ